MVVKGPAVSRVLAMLMALVALTACGGDHRTDAQIAQAELQAGLASHYAGRTSDAAYHYQRVLAHDKNNVWAFYNLGVLEGSAGRTKSAEDYYRKCLAADPNFAICLYNLAVLRTTPAPDEAIDLYQRAIQANPKMATAYLNLGFLMVSKNKPDEARALFQKSIDLDPSLKSRIAPNLLAPGAPTASPSPSPHG